MPSVVLSSDGAALAVPDTSRSQIRAIPALTGIRFVAAVLVLLYHYGATWSERLHFAPLSQFMHNGYLGVSVFFVLSGFILTHVHQAERVDRAFLIRFYQARFARLYPVYLLALIVALPVRGWPMTGADVVRVLLMVQSWTVPGSRLGWAWLLQAWTLSIELFFYLMFPLLLPGIRRLSAAAILGCIAVASALIVLGGLSSAAPGTDMPGVVARLPLPLLRLPEFILGMALCRWVKLRPGEARALDSRGLEALVLGVLVLTLALTASIQSKAFATLLTGLLIVQLYEGRGVISRLLASAPMALLGGASYALYLLQQPVRSYSALWLGDQWGRLASPALTLAVALLVFLCWEQPMRRGLLALMRPAIVQRNQ